jgi:glutathione S-transferase
VSSSKLVVHHLENSRSHRLLWLLEELELPYEVKLYKRHPVTKLAPPELRAIHPLGKSPVLTDGDTVLAESGAIFEELIERTSGKLRPVGDADVRKFRYYLHYAEGSLMPLLTIWGIVRAARKAPGIGGILSTVLEKALLSGYVGPTLEAAHAFLEAELTARPYFAGDAFSAADIMMAYPLEAATALDRKGAASRAACAAWLAKVKARPAYAKAAERGGGFRAIP